jgi:methionine synthase II (cobalamin-independent)
VVKRAALLPFEAGNVRHEHERRLWQDIKRHDGKILLPGVVSHATNLIEHPEVIAERIMRFAQCVGRENVLADAERSGRERSVREIVFELRSWIR